MNGSGAEFCEFLLKETDNDTFLDGVEVGFKLLAGYRTKQGRPWEKFVEELNARMREARYGYEYVHPEIMRVDNYFIHREVVVPALLLLHGAEYSSANTEYHEAHEAYRNGDYSKAVVEAAKSVESVLKIIGSRRGWSINPDTDALAKLVQAAFASQFIPSYMQTQVQSLRSMLDSGVGPVRNRRGAHGAGSNPVPNDPHVAAFQLHQAAAVIVFLVEQDRAIA